MLGETNKSIKGEWNCTQKILLYFKIILLKNPRIILDKRWKLILKRNFLFKDMWKLFGITGYLKNIYSLKCKYVLK